MILNSLQVSVGDEVDITTPIGTMGATGNVTGRHLHLECSTTQRWQCSTFLNPCDILGIPNVKGTVIHYDGEAPGPGPGPEPSPTEPFTQSKFPWVLLSRKLRNKRNF